jgi:hypothetical protein
MISLSDVIHLPFAADLTEAGIAHALRSLPYSFASSHPFDGMRRVVADTAVELAFRRYLSGQDIPYEVKGAIPFSNPDRYDVSLAGHRCHLKVFSLSDRGSISEMQEHPQGMLDWSVLVPSDEHAADGHKKDDLYIFAFLARQIAASQSDLKRVIETGAPYYLVHVMKDEWRRPMHWNPLGLLTLKSESDEAMLVEVHGQNEKRDFVAYTYHLPPKTKFITNDPFFSVTSLHVKRPAGARLGIHSPGYVTHVIGPRDWGNIWIHGLGIYLVGYTSHEEFQKCARPVTSTARIFPHPQVRVKSLGMPVSQLRPLGHLFQMVRSWEKRTTNEG